MEYKYSEGGYVPLPPIGNIILVYKKSGTFIPKDCEQARSQVFEYVEAVGKNLLKNSSENFRYIFTIFT